MPSRMVALVCVAAGLIGLVPRSVPARVISLEECIDEALRVNPAIDASRWQVRAMEGRVAEAEAGIIPKLTLTNLTGPVPDAEGDALDATSLDFTKIGFFYRLQLDAIWPVYTFGKITSAKEAAYHGLEAEQAAVEQQQADIIFNVKRAYYGVQLAEAIEAVLTDGQERLTNAIARMQGLLETRSADASETDLLKLQAFAARLNNQREEVIKGREMAWSALLLHIGKTRAEAAEWQVTELAPEQIALESLDDHVQTAMRARPEVRRMAAGVAAQSSKVKIERSDYYPLVFVGGQFTYAVAPGREDQDSPFANDDFNRVDGGVALGARWSLDFLTTAAKVGAAEAERSRSLRQREWALQGMSLEVERAYREVIEYQEKIKHSREGLSAARRLLLRTSMNYDVGLTDTRELLEALGAYAQLKVEYFRAIQAFNEAVAELSRATGNDIRTVIH